MRFAVVIASYLVGSIPFALLLGMWRGVDIRRVGSGNIGATNLGRALGRSWAIAGFSLDFAKGLFPVLVVLHALFPEDSDRARESLALGCALAAIGGHVFPIYLKFRGGKGVATAFGTMAGLAPAASLCAGALWFVIFKTARAVSLASLVAAVSFPLGVWLSRPGAALSEYWMTLAFSILVALLIIWRHRGNIARMIQGEELVFGSRASSRVDIKPEDPVELARILDIDRPLLVLGNGGFGTAMALVLDEAGRSVRVWGHDVEYTQRIQSTRRNDKFLPNIPLPESIEFGSDIRTLVSDVQWIVSSVPTQFLRETLMSIRDDLPARALILTCSKGFERGTCQLPSQIIADVLPQARVAVLSGPSHAEEIGQRLATTVVVAARSLEIARAMQSIFSTPAFRAYASSDPLGVEIAGASKNVIALAAGIAVGLGFGDNALAALVCRGASEMARLGLSLGAEVGTFSGLSGIGDLVATCTSEHSRNRSVGVRLGRGESLDEILTSTEKIAEGVETTRSIYEKARDLKVELPITTEVYRVLFEGKDARQGVADLMSRDLKTENDF